MGNTKGFTVKLSFKYRSIDEAFMQEVIDLMEYAGMHGEDVYHMAVNARDRIVTSDVRSVTFTPETVATFTTKNDRKDYVLPGAFDEALEAARELYDPAPPQYPSLADLNEEALERLGFDHWKHALNAVKKMARTHGKPWAWRNTYEKLTVWNCPADLVYKVAQLRGDGPGLIYELPNPADYDLR